MPTAEIIPFNTEARKHLSRARALEQGMRDAMRARCPLAASIFFMASSLMLDAYKHALTAAVSNSAPVGEPAGLAEVRAFEYPDTEPRRFSRPMLAALQAIGPSGDNAA